MPTYSFRNKNTGEEYDIMLRISELDEYKGKNPDIRQVLHAPKIVSSVGTMLGKTDGGWNDTLNRIKSGSGNKNTINTR